MSMSKTAAMREARARVTPLRPFGPFGRQWVYLSNSDGAGWRESIPRHYFQAVASRRQLIEQIAIELMHGPL